MPASSFNPALTAALDYALDHLASLDLASVAATSSLAELRDRIDLPLNEAGIDPVQVVSELAAGVEGGLLGSAGGRFFGWVIGGSLPAALAADWLTSAWDQNAGLYATAPAAAVVEETAGRWLKELLHLPATASFALVTGCQMAHVTCLAAARHAVLARCGRDVEQDGLAGSPPIRILTSVERHSSLPRAARLLGIGERSIVALPSGEDGRLAPEILEQALAASDAPTIVVLQAGDLNLGAFDDFATLIPIAHRHHAWVHVDGAFGLWAAASPAHRHLMRGCDQADSWSTDGHKWLNVPYDSGYAFVADSAAHRAVFAQRASYLTHDDQARDQMEYNPEWSRRARGFATYAALRELGTDGVADLIARTCDHAHALVTRIGALPGAQALNNPQLNQGMIRFFDPEPTATEADHDTFTDRTIAQINASGEAFFTGTTWRECRAMRVSVCNWQTSAADVDRVVQCVATILRQAGHPAIEALQEAGRA